jgi:hypothetical protein
VKAGAYFVSVKEGHRLLANYGWQEYENGVHQMSLYALKFTPWHLYEISEFSKLYAMLHEECFISMIESRCGIRHLLHLPDHIRKWSCGNRMTQPRGPYQTADAIVQSPGDWFIIDEVFYSSCDWRCERCRKPQCLGTPLPKASSCPDCGWEGFKSDRDAWLTAKAEFQRKHQPK